MTLMTLAEGGLRQTINFAIIWILIVPFLLKGAKIIQPERRNCGYYQYNIVKYFPIARDTNRINLMPSVPRNPRHSLTKYLSITLRTKGSTQTQNPFSL